MKKVIFALMGAALFLGSCAKQETAVNPYRTVVEYKPSTFTMTVEGNVTDVNLDWISMSQSGNKVTFTTQRNLTGLIRRAEYPISGTDFKLIVNQKSGNIDAAVNTALVSQSLGSALINVNIATSNLDDYSSWTIVYGKENDKSKGTEIKQPSMFVPGSNPVTITGLEEGVDYFVWAYVVTTEGNVVWASNTTGIIPPVYVAAGDDLQAAFSTVVSTKKLAPISIVNFLTSAHLPGIYRLEVIGTKISLSLYSFNCFMYSLLSKYLLLTALKLE